MHLCLYLLGDGKPCILIDIYLLTCAWCSFSHVFIYRIWWRNKLVPCFPANGDDRIVLQHVYASCAGREIRHFNSPRPWCLVVFADSKFRDAKQFRGRGNSCGL